MTRAAAYYRVSTAAQATEDRNSLAAQRAAFFAHCTAQGYEPGPEFTDVESGRRIQRAQYQRMLAAARAGEMNVIIVTFLDRFGRRQEEIALRVLELRNLGVTVEATEEDVSDFLFMALTAWKADQESQRIGARVRLAGQQKTLSGRLHSRPAFGYRKVKRIAEDGNVQTVVEVYEPEAAIVRDIFEWHDSGLGQRAIAFRLNQQGRLTANNARWSNAAVRVLLRRRTYVGDLVWGPALRENAIPPIVSRELWERTQQRLDARQRTPGRPSEFFLTGVIRCAHCGGPMQGTRHRNSAGVWYRAYRCGNNRRTGACRSNSHVAERCESAVLELLEALGASQVDEARDQLHDELARLREAIDRIDAELAKVAEKFRANMRDRHAGLFANDEQFREANEAVAAEQSALTSERERIALAIDRAEARQSDLTRLPERSRSLAASIAGLSPLEARARIRELVHSVEFSEGDYTPRVRLTGEEWSQ